MSRVSDQPHRPSPRDLDKISEILPYLCIGSYGTAEQEHYLEALQVTHTICLLEEIPSAISPRFENLQLPMSDYGDSSLVEVLIRAVPFIESARTAGGRVLIFCASGINRSPALAAAYLRVALHHPMDSALAMIARLRPIVSIHEGYLKQLTALPERLPA